MSDGVPERMDDQSVAIIRAGLAHALAADSFRAAPQLSAFLSFIVERAIDGRGSELKGYTIAVEALGRSAEFDPQSDPIVRVEAGRLRRTLGQYYAGEGHGDPVRITMPVGGYVPVFEFTGKAPIDEAEAEPVAESSSNATGEPVAASSDEIAASPAGGGDSAVSRRWPAAAILALLVALAALGSWYFASQGSVPAETERQSQAPVVAAISPRAPALPLASNLIVLAITVPDVPMDPKSADTLRRFSGLLVDAMARFDDLVSIKAPPAGSALPPDVDYVFEMSAQTVDGASEGFGRLRSVRDDRIVWTVSSSRPQGPAGRERDLAEIARRLAIRLAEPFGIIHADFRQFSVSPTMSCIFQALDYRRTLKAEDYGGARTCIEELIEKEPGFYPAWAQLTFLILGDYASSLDPVSGPPLDRALSAAVTAVRLAPSSARAHQAMMDALFARGATEDAIKAGREAASRNPYDPDIMADLGARYVQLNRPSEGLPLLERAIELSAGRPSWYDFFAFLGARLIGARRSSEPYAVVLGADTTPLSLLGRALQIADSGDKAGLEAVLKKLSAKAPLFGMDPGLYLSRSGFSSPVVDRILSDLDLETRSR
jgi:tetratricopeptide (TPR) repeat protein